MAASKIENAPLVELGTYITECDERNSNLTYGIDEVLEWNQP